MIARELRDRFRFFFEHAGYVVGERAVGAIALARAEATAEAIGLEVVWEWDDDADLGDHEYWCANARRRAHADNAMRHGEMPEWMGSPCDHQTEYAHADLPGVDTHLAGLGGIIDADRDYRRVVSAELCREAVDALPDARTRLAAEQERTLERVDNILLALAL